MILVIFVAGEDEITRRRPRQLFLRLQSINILCLFTCCMVFPVVVYCNIVAILDNCCEIMASKKKRMSAAEARQLS